MKRESGFSLFEVMIAGTMMIGLVMAVQQLLTSTAKSTGNLERRLHHRDLVEDLRFALSTPALCAANLGSEEIRDGLDVRLRLDRGTNVGGGTVLPDYGIKVTRLYFRNVQSTPRVRRVLLGSRGEFVGEYFETAATGELVLEAEPQAGGSPLRPATVARVAEVQRSGVLEEKICYGSHPPAGFMGAAGTQGENPAPASNSGKSGGTYVPGGECPIEDGAVKAALGRSHLFEGESTRVWVNRRPVSLRCRSGALERN